MHSVTLAFGPKPLNGFINNRSRIVVNLPLTKIDTNAPSLFKVEVNPVLTKSDLADGVTNEALQRQIFWNSIHKISLSDTPAPS